MGGFFKPIGFAHVLGCRGDALRPMEGAEGCSLTWGGWGRGRGGALGGGRRREARGT